MHKQTYKKPEIEVLKVRVEKGFALSRIDRDAEATENISSSAYTPNNIFGETFKN